MAELDEEMLERVARWCADAGRQAGAAEIRGALGPLGWDELLTVRALLADPPPARPLGPHALADLARGVPADVAAEREREGRYRREEEEVPRGVAAAEVRPPPRRKATRRARTPAIVVRRARDRVPEAPAAPAPPLPPLDELRLPDGRAVLERLVREHGGRRAVIARALRAGWLRADGAEVGEEDVAALLDLHGLARPFARRERDELLHALRAAGGVRPRAAEHVGLDAAGLQAALARLGVEREAEQIRGERRAELRARATLSDRVHLVLEEAARLEDLGLLAELEADLRARLPEHIRALRAGGGPLAAAFAESLSLDAAATAALSARFGLDLGPVTAGRERQWGSGRARAPGGRTSGGRPRAGGPRPDRRERDAAGGGRPGPRGPRTAPGGARPGPRGPRTAPGGARPGPRGPRTAPGGARPDPRGARPAPRGARPGGVGTAGTAPGVTRLAQPDPREARSGPRERRPASRGAPPPRGTRSGPARPFPGGPRGGERPAFSRPRSGETAPAARPPRVAGAQRTGARAAGPPSPSRSGDYGKPPGRPGARIPRESAPPRTAGAGRPLGRPGSPRPGGRPGSSRPGARPPPRGRGPRRP